MQKRGQFYIIGAAIIILIIMGLTSTVNIASVTPKQIKFFDISDNFEKESVKIVDYGVYTETASINQKVSDFYENYSRYALASYPDAYISFVYGNESSSTYGELNVTEASICLGTSEGCLPPESNDLKTPSTSSTHGDKVIVSVGRDISGNKVNYTFALKPNEKFYFIMVAKRGGETLKVVRE